MNCRGGGVRANRDDGRDVEPDSPARVIRSIRQLRSFAVASAILACGCKISDTLGQEVPDIPPRIPSATTVQFELGPLHGAPPSAGAAVAWRAMQEHLPELDSLAKRFEVPAAALAVVKDSTPRKKGLRWTWNIAGTVNSSPFTGFGVGQLTGAVYTWEVDVTAPTLQPPLRNRQVLLGQTDYAASTGVWNVYDLKTFPPGPPWVAEWTYKSDVASFIRVSILVTIPDGRSYDLLRENSLHTLSVFRGLFEYSVIWDSADGSGRYVLRGADALCWDAQHIDRPC